MLDIYMGGWVGWFTISQDIQQYSLDKHGHFDSCGFEAEDKYSDLALENKHHDWMFFKRFKMNLYRQIGVKRKFNLEADNGKQLDAMFVFSEMIRFFKNHLFEKCICLQKGITKSEQTGITKSQQTGITESEQTGITKSQQTDENKPQKTGITEEDILFVITVPAIWTDPAKQFMREAAIMAGIHKNRLLLSLEPEAASLFCKHVPVEEMANSAKGFNVFSSGSTYIVIDAGGGTIDITVQRVQENDTIAEIYMANGGNWGGTKVDEAFRELLEDIVGKNVMEKFGNDHKYDLLELFRYFEIKKRKIVPKNDDKITFTIPSALIEIHRTVKKCEIQDALKDKNRYKDKITCLGDKMRLSADFAKDLFSNSVKNIVEHLQKLVQIPAVKEATHILMVGGFSESPMLQDAVLEALKNKTLVVPNEAGLSVVKGAVIFGCDPSLIQYRKSKYTYGVSTSLEFDAKKHPLSRKIKTGLGILCRGIFDKHVEINQQIEYRIPQVERQYVVTEKDQTSLKFNVYISKDSNVKYVDDVDESDTYSEESNFDRFENGNKCIHLGELEINAPGHGLGRSATVAMTFGGTELKVEARNENGESRNAFFDLLQ